MGIFVPHHICIGKNKTCTPISSAITNFLKSSSVTLGHRPTAIHLTITAVWVLQSLDIIIAISISAIIITAIIIIAIVIITVLSSSLLSLSLSSSSEMGTRSAFTFMNGPVQGAFSVQCERRRNHPFCVQIERNGDVSRKILYSAERVL